MFIIITSGTITKAAVATANNNNNNNNIKNQNRLVPSTTNEKYRQASRPLLTTAIPKV